MKKLRVPIASRSPKEVLELAKKILNKHVADNDSSPLIQLNWKVLGPAIENAAILHDQAEKLRSESMQKMQDRNLYMEEIIEGVRNARDILTGTYKKDMRKLNSWGYNVIEAQAVKQKRSEE